MELFLKLTKGSWYGMAANRFDEVKKKKHIQSAVTFVQDTLIQVKKDSILGTSEDQCEIVLDERSLPSVSCVLYLEKGKWWIKSIHALSSPSLREAVLINDELVTQEPRALENGDEIELGRVELEVILQ